MLKRVFCGFGSKSTVFICSINLKSCCISVSITSLFLVHELNVKNRYKHNSDSIVTFMEKCARRSSPVCKENVMWKLFAFSLMWFGWMLCCVLQNTTVRRHRSIRRCFLYIHSLIFHSDVSLCVSVSVCLHRIFIYLVASKRTSFHDVSYAHSILSFCHSVCSILSLLFCEFLFKSQTVLCDLWFWDVCVCVCVCVLRTAST